MARTIGVKMCICNWFTFLNNYFSCLFFCFGLLFKSSCISCSLSIDLCNLLNGEFPACFSHIFVVAPPSTCACSRLSAFVLLVFLVWLLCHPHPALSWMTSPHHPPPFLPSPFNLISVADRNSTSWSVLLEIHHWIYLLWTLSCLINPPHPISLFLLRYKELSFLPALNSFFSFIAIEIWMLIHIFKFIID